MNKTEPLPQNCADWPEETWRKLVIAVPTFSIDMRIQ